mgnify:CR=1 FL=1
MSTVSRAMVSSSFVGTTRTAAVAPSAEMSLTGTLLSSASFFALLTIIVWLWWRGEFPSAIYTSNPKGHFWRGSVAVISMVCNFSALGLLPLETPLGRKRRRDCRNCDQQSRHAQDELKKAKRLMLLS